MAKCSQKVLPFPILLLLLLLLFIFLALFFGSVESNGDKPNEEDKPNEKVAFVKGMQKSYAYPAAIEESERTAEELNAKIAAGYEIVSSANAGGSQHDPNFLWTLVKKDDDDDDDKKKQNADLMQKIDTLIEKIDNDKNKQHLDNFVGKVETLGHKLDTFIEKIDQDRKEQKESVDTLVKAISSLVEQLDKKSGKLTLW